MAIHRKYTEWGRLIDIGEGEAYCPKCNGKGCKLKTGTTSNDGYNAIIKMPCGFCQGYGKTDWIQMATNEPRITPPEESLDYLKNNLSFNRLNFMEFAALYLAKQIDKEIIKTHGNISKAPSIPCPVPSEGDDITDAAPFKIEPIKANNIPKAFKAS